MEQRIDIHEKLSKKIAKEFVRKRCDELRELCMVALTIEHMNKCMARESRRVSYEYSESNAEES